MGEKKGKEEKRGYSSLSTGEQTSVFEREADGYQDGSDGAKKKKRKEKNEIVTEHKSPGTQIRPIPHTVIPYPPIHLITMCSRL